MAIKLDFSCQENILSILAQSMRTGHIAHAYLFVGERAVPKLDIALYFAKMLNCLSLNKEGEIIKPCMQCVNCLAIDKGSFFDVRIINAEEENSAIKIEDIRGLQSQINLRPFSGLKKVYIICRAEYLTEASANALLKTLEEPPKDAVLILTCENMREILPTVISRCRILKFDHQDYMADNLLTEELLDKCKINRQWRDIWAMVDYLSRYERHDLEKILEQLTWRYRDILIFKQTRNKQLIMNSRSEAQIIQGSDEISVAGCTHIIEALIAAQQHLSANINIKVLLATLGMSIQEARNN